MGDFFKMIADLWKSIFAVLDSHPVNIFGYDVSLTYIIMAFLIFGFVVSVYWKGAKS